MSHLKNRDSNKPRREQRQAEATIRQELASKRTPVEQLTRLDSGVNNPYFPGAKAERTKLAARLTVKAVADASQRIQEREGVQLPTAAEVQVGKGAQAKPEAQAAPQKPRKAPRAVRKP